MNFAENSTLNADRELQQFLEIENQKRRFKVCQLS